MRTLELTPLEPRAVPTGVPVHTQDWTPLTDRPVFASGLDGGTTPTVRVYDAVTGEVLNEFDAYDPAFAGGVQVALGDLDGDGTPDVLTAPGPGGAPNVRAFSGRDGSVLLNFFAYESSFRGGANVAAADLNGDGRAEVIVGTGLGGGPRVRVFDTAAGVVVRDFFAYEPTFRGGVNVAAGDLGDGIGPAVIAGSGAGGGPAVKVFRFDTGELAAAYFAYDDSSRGGVFVAAGDLDGDGRADVVTGPGDGPPRVKVFDPEAGKEKLDFVAGDGTAGGARVGIIPAIGETPARLVTGSGPGAPAAIRLYAGLAGDGGQEEPPGDAGNLGGVFVAG